MAPQSTTSTTRNANSHGPVLIRKASALENYYYMLSITGSQSTIVVGATYGSPSNPSKRLTKSSIVHAVSKLVQNQPSFSIVFSTQPSSTAKDKTEGYIARLPHLNVEDCIEFWDDIPEDEPSGQIISKIHSNWIDPSDHSKALWKVYVVNMHKVYFAFVHIICDGRSGGFFHQQLLTALNDIEHGKIRITNKVNYKRVVGADYGEFRDVIQDDFVKDAKLNMFGIILKFILYSIIRLLLAPTYVTFGDSARPKYTPSMAKFAPPEERMKNKIVSLKLEKVTMQSILQKCKANGTTFTVFLDILFNTSLCANIYPRSKVQLTAIVIDLRGRFPHKIDGRMCNAATTVDGYHWTSRYAAIGKSSKGPEHVETDVPGFWKLARASKEEMHHNIGERAIQQILSLTLAPKTLEEFLANFYPSLPTMMNFSMYISNLGVLVPVDVDKGRTWTFTGADWASSTLRNEIAPGLNACIVSVADGDCVINMGYPEGMYDDEMVPRLKKVMQSRIDQILRDSDDQL